MLKNILFFFPFFYQTEQIKVVPQGFLKFESTSKNIPSPEKQSYGGEDAHYADSNVLCVADGVGGWNEVGVNPALYSRKLIDNVKQFYYQNPQKYSFNAKELLIEAANNNNETGSSTLVIATLNPAISNVQIANIGDSGFAIFRKVNSLYEIYQRSKQQQHEFNFPFQIGTEGDRPQMAEEYSISVQENDLIILGSDGLFDNVYDQEILDIVNQNKNQKDFLNVLPEKLAKVAYNHSLDTKFESPFSKEAKLNNFLFEGGKSDDITVVVAKIVSNQQLIIINKIQ